MKLTHSQQNVVYNLIAVGGKPVTIVQQINNEYKPTKEFTKQQVNYYLKVFKSLPPDEQISHLPYSMQESFAVQEVRINDDIKDLQRVNEILDATTENKENDMVEESKGKKLTRDSVVELMRLKLSIKNRIGQELGQVRAMSKAGVGNLNMMQNVITHYHTLVADANLSEQDVIDVVKGIGEKEKENSSVPKPKD